MISNFGLTRILSLTTNKFWQLCDMSLNAEGEEKKSLVVGMQQKMDTQPLSHTG
jgi:hypothetical protein